MKQDDLIKKLENLETPEIELPGHRQALRMALLNSPRFKERTIFGWAKILAPVAAAVVLIAVVGFLNLIQPQLQIARAKEIARNDFHVQALMDEHKLGIAEVKLQDGEAFVVLAPEFIAAYAPESASAVRRFFSWPSLLLRPPAPTDEGGLSPPSPVLPAGYILQIDLFDKKVSGFGEIDEVAPLGEINLDDIEFVKLGPPEDAGPEETDPG